MHRTFWLAIALLGLTVVSSAQGRLNDNPTIEFTTSAIPAHKAIDEIARLAEKKIRVAEPLSHQPVIMRLHNAPYKDVLQWLADTLHGRWIDKDNYKILTRTNYVSLSLRNGLQRKRAEDFNRFLEARRRDRTLRPLTPDVARQTILKLNELKADPTSKEYANALLLSADSRLVDQAMDRVRPLDLASATYPNHAAFANVPRFLQGSLALSPKEFNQLVAEQNLWTNALKALSQKYPDLRFESSKRAFIPPKSRLLLVFSDPVDGLPTRVEASVLGPGGAARVRVVRNIDIPRSDESATDWSSHQLGTTEPSQLSQEFLMALRGDGRDSMSNEQREALMAPTRVDPLSFVISDGILNVATNKGWNVVACVPDAALLNPALQASMVGNTLDNASLMKALEKYCVVNLYGTTMKVWPKDALSSEGARTEREALEAYLASLVRVGYSTTAAESTLASLHNAGFEPSLVQCYARMLNPNAIPFIDTSIEALAFYGSLSPQQKKWLNNGMSYGLNDLNGTLRLLLGGMLLNSPKRILIDKLANNIYVDRNNPEITNLVDGPLTPNEKVFLVARRELVLRVRGVNSSGRLFDEVLTSQEAPVVLKKQGPWRSIEYATADANTIKLTLRVSAATDVVHFLRDYPNGFTPFGSLNSLPADFRKALAK